MAALIDVKDVSVRYGQAEVVQNISCEIQKGDFVGLVGPNGGGKTTLAKAILGLLPIYTGQILLFGEGCDTFSDFQKIGYLPQKHTGINPLFPASVKETVTLGLLASKKWPKQIKKQDLQKVDEQMQNLDIIDLKDKLLSELSGGEQQKVLLARALVFNPDIIILDEPTTALDPSSREGFFAILKKLNEQSQTTIILITHDVGYVGKYANKLLYIDRHLVFFGKIADFCPSGEIVSCFEKNDKHIIWHQHD
jgi:zinc transport system ATP-binding protein